MLSPFFRDKQIIQVFGLCISCIFFLLPATSQTLSTIFTLNRSASEQTTNLVDFNSDGLNDLIVGAYSGNRIDFYRNTGTTYVLFNSFTNTPSFATTGWAVDNSNSFLQDFDGDGRKDLLINFNDAGYCTYSSMRVYWGVNTPLLFDSNTFTEVHSCGCCFPIVIDIDNNGRKDIVIEDPFRDNTVYKSNTNRIFTPVSTYSTPRDVQNIDMDFNGDGNSDLVAIDNGFAPSANGGLYVWNGNGNGTFQTPMIYEGVGERPKYNFQKLDTRRIAYNTEQNNAKTLYVRSNTSVSQCSILPTNAEFIGNLDYNGDGFNDLVVVGDTLGTLKNVYVYLANIGGGFCPTSTIVQLVKATNLSFAYAFWEQGKVRLLSYTANSLTISEVEICTPATVSISAPSTFICNNNPITLTANPSVSGNYTYTWYRNGSPIFTIFPSVTPTFDVTQAGTYSVSISENGCASPLSAPITVTSGATPTVFISANRTSICPNNPVTLTANPSVLGNYTYTWYKNGYAIYTIFPLVEPTFDVTQSGTYSVLISENGCTSPLSAPAIVTSGVAPSVSATAASATAICSGSSVVLNGTASNAATFQWFLNGNSLSDGAMRDYQATLAGNYTFVATSNNGCVSDPTNPIAVTSKPSPTVDISGNTSFCKGTTMQLTASGGGTYTWNNNATTNPRTISDGGTYSVSVTGSNGCIGSKSVTVTQNPTPSLSLPQNTQVCKSLSLSFAATATGGTPNYAYIWNDGATANQRFITPLAQTTYTVTVTDSKGCKNTAMATVNVNERPSAKFTENNALQLDKSICQNNAVTLNTSVNNGANPYTYAWTPNIGNNSSSTTGPLSTVGVSTYTLYVTDRLGCVSDAVVANIAVKPLPIPSVTAAPSTICANNSTTLNASASSGNPPYISYSWSNNLGIGANVSTPILSVSTSYTVTVTDNLGCTNTTTVPITVNPLPIVTMTAQPPNVCEGSTTRLSVSATNGSGVYQTYTWNPRVSTTNSYTTGPLSIASNFRVTVTDSRTCRGESSILVGINFVPIAKAGINDTITCAKPNITLNGTITANNAATVAVQWQRKLVNGGTTIIGNNLSAPNINQTGTYIFIAQNTATGCSSFDTLVIAVDTVHPLFTLMKADSARCSYSADGKITTIATIANAPISTLMFKLDNGVFGGSNTFLNLIGGNYGVTVKARNGCTDVRSIVVPKPQEIITDISTKGNFTYFYEGDVVPMASKVLNIRGNPRYQWTSDPSVNFSCTNCPTPKFTINSNTLVKLVASDAYNCSAQDTMSFNLRKKFDPDIITPNGSGNNTLGFPSLENCLIVGDCGNRFPNNEITIVNRWGSVVFYAKPYLNDWRGTNQNGAELPGGTYYYILRLNLSEGDIVRGNVLIMR